MKEGQVFYTDYSKPDGFCDEAWKDIYQYVLLYVIDLTTGVLMIGLILRNIWSSNSFM